MVSTQADLLEADSIFAGRYRIKRLLGQGDRKRTYLKACGSGDDLLGWLS